MIDTAEFERLVITGIKVMNGQSNDDANTDYSGMYGEEGYVLELENELIDTDQLQTVANIIGEQIVGARFRNLEGDLVYNPLVEFGDMVYTYDRLGNNYNALMLGKYGLYAQQVQNNVIELWEEDDPDQKWGGYIIRYLNHKVRINTNSLFTNGCELGANFSTDGSATIGKSLSVGGNATVNGSLMFYDLENQAKTSGKVKRQPVASVSAEDSQVAYLFSGTGSKFGDTATYRRLGIRAKWGGSGFSTDYLYTTSQVSDIRLKENIESSETDALETVNRMKVRQFDWKEWMGGWHQNIGFVADELEEIDPNLALGGGYDENGEMDVKQINSPYLLNSSTF